MNQQRILRTFSYTSRRFSSNYKGSENDLKKALGVSEIWREQSKAIPNDINLNFNREEQDLSSLLRKLFKPNLGEQSILSKYHKEKKLSSVLNDDEKFISEDLFKELPEQVDKPMAAAAKADPSLSRSLLYWQKHSKFERQKNLEKPHDATSILYWNCLELSFDPSDFARILPHPNQWAGHYDNTEDIDMDFTVLRSRNPANLCRWLGYYLEFQSSEAAYIYLNETRDAQLCGLQVKFKFVTKERALGIRSHILEAVPSVSRRMCALVYGLPYEVNDNRISRVLWDYELIDDDKNAIKRLPNDRVNYGGSPVLLRFKSEEEAERFVREFHGTIWPHTDMEILAEVID